jgi:hypothetical protein
MAYFNCKLHMYIKKIKLCSYVMYSVCHPFYQLCGTLMKFNLLFTHVVRFEVISAVTVKIYVLWSVVPCSMA